MLRWQCENAKAPDRAAFTRPILTGVVVCCIDNEATILEGMKWIVVALGCRRRDRREAAEVGKALQTRGQRLRWCCRLSSG
jgi:hypothetical protein